MKKTKKIFIVLDEHGRAEISKLTLTARLWSDKSQAESYAKSINGKVEQIKKSNISKIKRI
jgi:hypothetical protein